MFFVLQSEAFGKVSTILAAALIYPLWLWLAIRTVNCLQLVTGHAISFPKRTVWLVKFLALVVGVGGLFGVSVDLGVRWYAALLPVGAVLFFALRERVQDIVSPKPIQNAAAYRSSWNDYRRLRANLKRSWLALGAVILSIIIMLAGSIAWSRKAQEVTLIIAVISTIVVMV